MQPNNRLIKKYAEKIDDIKLTGQITDGEYYSLRTSRVARNLLKEKTFGDPDSFTDKTLTEILADYKRDIKGEEAKKYLQEKERHMQSRKELTSVKEDKERITRNVEKWAELTSTIISRGLYAAITIIAIFAIYTNIQPAFIQDNKTAKNILIGFVCVITLLNMIYGFNIRGFGEKVKKWVKDKIMQHLLGR